MGVTEFELLGEFKIELQLEEGIAAPLRAELSALVQSSGNAQTRPMRGAAAMRPHIAVKNGRPHFTLPARSTRHAARERRKGGVCPRLAVTRGLGRPYSPRAINSVR
jgi:hypothetical protein